MEVFKLFLSDRVARLGSGWLGVALVILYGLPLLLMPVFKLTEGLAWHDQQRLLQVFLFCVVGAHAFYLALRGAPISSWSRLSEGDGRLLLLIMACGLMSVIFSVNRAWSAVEYVLFVLLLQFSYQVSSLRRDYEDGFDRLILIGLFLLCYVLVIFFLVNFVKQAAWGVGRVNIASLFHGFSTVRFMGQFQTLTLPLLVIPMLWANARPLFKYLALTLCSMWWLLAIASATRGTWLGMAVAAVLLSVLGVVGRRWVIAQVLCFLIGGVLYVALLHWVPGWLGIEILSRPEDRLHASLMGRDVLWGAAWEMIKSSPLLGWGPMSFASLHNMYGAHPHQSFLQWAAEWGVPSAMAVGWLVSKGVLSVYEQCRLPRPACERDMALKVSLLAAVVASAAQSAVDGVLVMPVSQVWLALLAGWLWGLCKRDAVAVNASALGRWAWLVVIWLAIAVLLYIVIRDFSLLQDRTRDYLAQGYRLLHPRFWAQGWID